jgi:dCTP deaminase
MILSNVEIINCINLGYFSIRPLAGTDPTKPPFNTSAVDLRLSDEIFEPDQSLLPFQLDLTTRGIAQHLRKHGKLITMSANQPYSLEPKMLVLAKTREVVSFPLSQNGSGVTYSARVEGRSSLARCGVLVHFTAPTIHAGFHGTITLEIINLGAQRLLLKPDLYACQLIIEEVKGSPLDAPNQFKGQNTATGTQVPSTP